MTQVKEETPKELNQEGTDVTAKPVSTADAPKEEETPVTKDGSVSIQEVSGEQILNGGRDSLEGNPVEGINEKLKESKDTLDTQNKAVEAIDNGTSGLNPIEMAEVQNGLVKDVNSDRPVYETASAAAAAMKAAGKLSTDEK